MYGEITLKTQKPWQFFILLIVHIISVVYVLYRALPIYLYISYAQPLLIVTTSLGIIALVYLIRGIKTAYALEALYCISWIFDYIYPPLNVYINVADRLVFLVILAGLLSSNSMKQYYGWSKPLTQCGERPIHIISGVSCPDPDDSMTNVEDYAHPLDGATPYMAIDSRPECFQTGLEECLQDDVEEYVQDGVEECLQDDVKEASQDGREEYPQSALPPLRIPMTERFHSPFGTTETRTTPSVLPSDSKRILITAILALTVSIALIPIVNNLNQVFYMAHSRQDHQKILSYIDDKYGAHVINIDNNSYKPYGYVRVELDDGRYGKIEAVNGVIEDRLALDAYEEQYKEKIKSIVPEDFKYSLRFAVSYNEACISAYISLVDFTSLTMFQPLRQQGDELKNTIAMYGESLYQIMCLLIDDGYSVDIELVPLFLRGLPFADHAPSLLFPFLNSPPPGIYKMPYAQLVFSEKCTKEEFMGKLERYIETLEE